MTNHPATAAEIRAHYKSLGDAVRIRRDGRVEFRRNGDGPWLDGRWVSEYRVDDGDDTGRAYLTVRLT